MKLDRRLLRLVVKSRFALFLAVGLGLAGGVLAVIQARLLSRALNGAFLGGLGLEALGPTLGWLLVVILLRAAGIWGLEAAAHQVAARVKESLRSRLFDHLLALGPARLGSLNPAGEAPEAGGRTGELANTAVDGIEALDAYYSQYLPQLALAALIPLAYLVLVLPIDLLSAAVLLVTAPLIPVFMILIGQAAEALTGKQWATLSRLSAYFLDVLQGLTSLKILGRSRAQVEVIAAISERYRKTTLGVLRVTFLSALALELVSTLSTAVVAVQIGLRLLYGWVSFEEAFFILVLAPEFYQPLRMLGTRFHAGMAGAAAGKRIFEILETPLPHRASAPDYEKVRAQSPSPEAVSTSTRAGAERHSPQIMLEKVSFTYPDGREALSEVSLTLPAGKRTALVGPSGAGKSTLAALLLGFLEQRSGEIRVDGCPLEKIPPDEWRELVAWVPQNPYLFHASVAENIRLGRPDASPEEVAAAARLAHAHPFIQALPEGYDTLIGERGARLSGGQAQRLALARAFLKNAPVLILDEATANLDPENEAEVQGAVQALMQGRTVLVIAHRLATVVGADQIYVLSEGKLQQAGDHQTLLAESGLYRGLVEAGLDGLVMDPGAPERQAFEAAPGFLDAGGSVPAAQPDRAEPASAAGPDPLAGESENLGSTFWRLAGLVWPFRGRILLAALLGFATVASSVGLMSASAYIIASAALHPSIAVLQVAIVGVRFFGLARGVFRYLERLVSHSVTFEVLARLRVWFYSALEPLAPARLMEYRGGDLLSRAIGDIASLENFYVRALAPPLVAALALLGMGIFFSAYSIRLAVVLVLFLLACGAALPLGIRLLGRKPGRQALAARASLNVALVDGIQGMADLAAFGQGRRQAGLVAAAGQELAGAQRAQAHLGGLQAAGGSLLSNLGMWTILLLGISMITSGRISGVDLAVLVLAALTSFEAVLPLPQAAQYLEQNLQAARRLFELVDALPEVEEPEQPLKIPQELALEIRGLSFGYDWARKNGSAVLERVSFNLAPGGKLAVVGPSGAGKSTLVHLLLRFWDYSRPGNAGQIFLNGHALSCYRPDEVRQKMAVVSQNTYLFNASLRENLLIARPAASTGEILRAVERAQLQELIGRLPQGLDTWIGESGQKLSAGERQRVAIARAILRDAPLLILDEATANLDTLTEREVLEALHALMEGRSTLMITHRLVSMEKMDEILVLRGGRIAERGRHQDLIQQGGWYAQMWRQQNSLLLQDQKIN